MYPPQRRKTCQKHIKPVSSDVDGWVQLLTMKSLIDLIVSSGNPSLTLQAAVACDRTDLVAVSDVFEEKAEVIRQRYGAERAYTDYQQMIETEKPDIVCIATRPGPHADITVFAAENNVKGIYCEKTALLCDG